MSDLALVFTLLSTFAVLGVLAYMTLDRPHPDKKLELGYRVNALERELFPEKFEAGEWAPLFPERPKAVEPRSEYAALVKQYALGIEPIARRTYVDERGRRVLPSGDFLLTSDQIMDWTHRGSPSGDDPYGKQTQLGPWETDDWGVLNRKIMETWWVEYNGTHRKQGRWHWMNESPYAEQQRITNERFA